MTLTLSKSRASMRLSVSGCAQDAAKTNGVCEIKESQRYRDDGVDRAVDAEPPWSETDGNHEYGVEERFYYGGPAVRLHDGQHANAGACVVVAIKPCDGHEVRKLPDEEDGEERDRGPFNAAAGRGPAEQGAHGAGKCADKCCQSRDALERRVDGHVGERGEEGERNGEQVGVQQQPIGAEGECADAGDNSLGERDAAGGRGRSAVRFMRASVERSSA